MAIRISAWIQECVKGVLPLQSYAILKVLAIGGGLHSSSDLVGIGVYKGLRDLILGNQIQRLNTNIAKHFIL